MAHSFGPFLLDVGERRLLRDGCVVPLAGKAFDTLRLLVEGAGKLQTQQSLIDRLWPDVVVEPHPDQLAKGIDVQLDKAVDVLQEEVLAFKKKAAGGVASAQPPEHLVPAVPPMSPVAPMVGSK